MQSSGLKTAIVGARGYSGLELSRLLLRHPHARLEACFATSADWRLSDYLPEKKAESVPVLPLSDLEAFAQGLDAIFLATPTEVSMDLVPRLHGKTAAIIDLSGAFRLETEAFRKGYGLDHTATELLPQAQYGLVPWIAQPTGSLEGSTRLIANPGCYATSVLMALLPLLKWDLIQEDSIVIDSKSGATGAGRKASEKLLFTEVEGECLPYRVGRHQHLPEIAGTVLKQTGVTIRPHFTTHLLPVRRGILTGIYAKLSSDLSTAGAAAALEKVSTAFENAYGHYPLVQHAPIQDASSPGLLSLKRIAGSARTHISYTVEEEKLYVFSTIDNLLKGAASQALENFNLLNDLPPWTGLLECEGSL